MSEDLETLVNEKTAKLLAKSPWMEEKALALTVARATEAPGSLHAKQVRFLKIADRFNTAVAPVAACRRGCAHCCHMPTMIYAHEAERLAAASGRKMARPPLKPFHVALDESYQYYRQPCPFLRENLCSAYEARPLICRLHHSLNDDTDDCRVDVPQDQRKPIASYNVDSVEVPFHLFIAEASPSEVVATIHDFFPG